MKSDILAVCPPWINWGRESGRERGRGKGGRGAEAGERTGENGRKYRK